jgi:retron-type reverse transcriptase
MHSIQTINDLAERMGISEFAFFKLALRAHRHYRHFHIAKRSGGERIITAPSPQLKRIQRWIARHLLGSQNIHDAATAYRAGASIVVNATPHTNKDFVFNADIKDFFGSIDIKRVYKLFRALGYRKTLARNLTRLCTYRRKLPQGAPTSPAIANLVCVTLDEKLAQLCAQRGWAYTRYCDDITVSGDGLFGDGRQQIYRIVREEGFRINSRKVRLISKHGRQTVTGLVVNRKPNLPRRRRRQLRAIFHQASLHPDRYRHLHDNLQGQVALLEMVTPDSPVIAEYKRILATLLE